MKAIALALATGLAAVGPAWAQDAKPHPKPAARWSQEAKRYLTDCQARPGSQGDCLV
jgi:hypothetical protein